VRLRRGIFKETGSGTKLDLAERAKVLALPSPDKLMQSWSLSFPGGRSTLDLLNTLRELENWKVAIMEWRSIFVAVWTNAGDVSFRHCGV
jgi:hypothetical protein